MQKIFKRGTPEDAHLISTTQMYMEKWYFSRWITLIFALLVQLACGSAHTFGIYSKDIQDKLDLSLNRVQLFALMKNIGTHVSLPCGLFYDRFGPRLTILIGSLLNFIGYFFVYTRSANIVIYPYGLMLFFFIFSGHAAAWADCAAIATTIKNFPKYRGLAAGFLSAFSALSASILTIIYVIFLKPDAAMFLLFQAIGLSAILLITIPFVNKVPQTLSFDGLTLKPNEGKAVKFRFALGIMILLCIASVLTTLNMLEAFNISIHETTRVICFGLICGIFLTFFIIPIISPPYTYPANLLTCAPPDTGSACEYTIDADVKAWQAPDLTVWEAIQTANFWLFFITLFGVQSSGLMVINNIAQLVESLGGHAGDQDVYISLYSIANSLGRIIVGFASDAYQEKVVRPIFLIITVIGMALSNVLMGFADLNLLYISVPLVGFWYGASWSLMPVITCEIFGLKHFGANYSALAFASALGSFLISTEMTSWLYEIHVPDGSKKCFGKQCFQTTFVVNTCICFICTLLAFVMYHRTHTIYRCAFIVVSDTQQSSDNINLGRGSSIYGSNYFYSHDTNKEIPETS